MDIAAVLERAHRAPFKTKSDFARQFADGIAVAASDGFISTRLAAGLYAREWFITPLGLSHLYALKGEHHQ